MTRPVGWCQLWLVGEGNTAWEEGHKQSNPPSGKLSRALHSHNGQEGTPSFVHKALSGYEVRPSQPDPPHFRAPCDHGSSDLAEPLGLAHSLLTEPIRLGAQQR